MPQRGHALPLDPAWGLGRIIDRDKGVVIAPVSLRKVLGADVGGERPNVPRADAEDVGHSKKANRTTAN